MFNLAKAIPIVSLRVAKKWTSIIGYNFKFIGWFKSSELNFEVVPGLKESPAIDPKSKIIGFKDAEEKNFMILQWRFEAILAGE